MSHVFDELSVNVDECTRKSSRSRTMTEKGRIYHDEMLQKAAKDQSRKAAKSTLPGKAKSFSHNPENDTSDINLVKDESRKLDRILPDVIDANSKLLETMDNKQMSEQSKLINGIQLDAFQIKQDIYKWLAQHNEQRSTRSSHRKSSNVTEVKVSCSSKEQSVNIAVNLLTLVNSSKDRY